MKIKRFFTTAVLATAFFVLPFQVFGGSQDVSSATAATIITNARYYLNESAASFWSAAELLVYVNDGTRDIVSRTRCLEATESIDLANDTLEYTITENYIDVTAVHYVDANGDIKALKRGHPDDVGNVNMFGATEEPEYWYEWGNKIGVYPVLVTRTSQTITVYYVSLPADVASDAAVKTPAYLDRALTLYVAAQAFLKDRQLGRHAALMQEYHAELDRFRQDFNVMMKPPNSEEAQ